jgi:predicted RNA-binding Zn-ribbon protein involved in translation (DUF1610 family)
MTFIVIVVIIATFIFGLFSFFKYRSPEYKGAVGESIVSKEISKLPEHEYKILNNIYLKAKKCSSQIDHIIVSIYGIFVIETKNYSGWIFGSENQEYWTQTIYNNRNKFRNPIKQNWAHIYALKEILPDYKYIRYYPIIVFTGTAELKNITSNIPVIYDYEIIQTIMDHKETPILLSIEQVENIILRINQNNIQDKDINEKHIQQIYNQIYEQKQKINSLICPKCGNKLIVRKGTYGSFYGCSNYPNCRFKQDIK